MPGPIDREDTTVFARHVNERLELPAAAAPAMKAQQRRLTGASVIVVDPHTVGRRRERKHGSQPMVSARTERWSVLPLRARRRAFRPHTLMLCNGHAIETQYEVKSVQRYAFRASVSRSVRLSGEARRRAQVSSFPALTARLGSRLSPGMDSIKALSHADAGAAVAQIPVHESDCALQLDRPSAAPQHEHESLLPSGQRGLRHRGVEVCR